MTSSQRPPGNDTPLEDRDPVDALAAEYVERLRRGDAPSIESYAAANPELADDIRELFPTIAAMEQFKAPGQSPAEQLQALAASRPERLGDFRIVREIGRGGMGIVYEAEQQSLGRRVAVKVLPRSGALDAKHLLRFQREARTAAGLHHTNIVPVFGVGHQDGFRYYVMQYIEGCGLDQVLMRLEADDQQAAPAELTEVVRQLMPSGAGEAESAAHAPEQSDRQTPPSTPGSQGLHPTEPLPRQTSADPERSPAEGPARSKPTILLKTPAASTYWASVARLGIQVAEALDYAHRKRVLHRDIKPANLIVDGQGIAWVADFGLAKALEQDHVSRSGDVLGTPAYMAPEQLRGQADARSDVYSLGLTLYELASLSPAYADGRQTVLQQRLAGTEPVRPRQIRPAIPRDLETIVLKAIAAEPDRRYQTAADLADDLQRFLEGRTIRARRATGFERFWRWCRRNPVVAGLSATAVLLLLLVAVTASVAYVRTSRALAGERTQRQRAETATGLAVEVLDRVYERFTPKATTPPDGAPADRFNKPVLSEGTAAVLEDMLVFYDRLAEQGGDNSEYLERIALANQRVGDIRHHLDQLDAAAAAYRKALKLYDDLGPASVDQPRFMHRASVYTELGLVLHRMGQLDEAKQAWQGAMAMFESVDDSGSLSADLLHQKQRVEDLLSTPPPSRRQPPQGLPGHPANPHAPPRPGMAPPRGPEAPHNSERDFRGRAGPPHGPRGLGPRPR